MARSTIVFASSPSQFTYKLHVDPLTLNPLPTSSSFFFMLSLTAMTPGQVTAPQAFQQFRNILANASMPTLDLLC